MRAQFPQLPLLGASAGVSDLHCRDARRRLRGRPPRNCTRRGAGRAADVEPPPPVPLEEEVAQHFLDGCAVMERAPCRLCPAAPHGEHPLDGVALHCTALHCAVL